MRGWGTELARGTSGGTIWYLADRLGSVRGEYTTGSGGKPVGAKTDYDPFGQPEAGTGLGAPSDYGFTGEPQGDGPAAGGGLVQLRARWYQPGGGQFTSRDPFAGDAGTPQTLNPYAYAHNDPANLTDPTGMSPLVAAGTSGAGEAGASGNQPTGAWLAVATEYTIVCCSPSAGTFATIFCGYDSSVTALAFDANGETIVGGMFNKDDPIRQWDVAPPHDRLSVPGDQIKSGR